MTTYPRGQGPRRARPVLPAPPKMRPPAKGLLPGSEAAREAGCRCWASYRSLVTGADYKLDPDCPLGHTEADLEPLRQPGGMTGDAEHEGGNESCRQ